MIFGRHTTMPREVTSVYHCYISWIRWFSCKNWIAQYIVMCGEVRDCVWCYVELIFIRHVCYILGVFIPIQTYEFYKKWEIRFEFDIPNLSWQFWWSIPMVQMVEILERRRLIYHFEFFEINFPSKYELSYLSLGIVVWFIGNKKYSPLLKIVCITML